MWSRLSLGDKVQIAAALVLGGFALAYPSAAGYGKLMILFGLGLFANVLWPHVSAVTRLYAFVVMLFIGSGCLMVHIVNQSVSAQAPAIPAAPATPIPVALSNPGPTRTPSESKVLKDSRTSGEDIKPPSIDDIEVIGLDTNQNIIISNSSRVMVFVIDLLTGSSAQTTTWNLSFTISGKSTDSHQLNVGHGPGLRTTELVAPTLDDDLKLIRATIYLTDYLERGIIITWKPQRPFKKQSSTSRNLLTVRRSVLACGGPMAL